MTSRLLLTAIGAVSLALLTACSSSTTTTSSPTHQMPGMTSAMPGASMSTSSHAGSMDNMPMSSGNGLSATDNGYTLTVRSQLMNGMSMPLTFVITKHGKAVTDFDAEQTKLLHLYLIRSDLAGFQHLHPTMASDGTWSATPSAPLPGDYRIYVQFVPHADAVDGALVLSRATTVVGSASSSPLPSPSSTTETDGYSVTVTGTPMAGTDSELKLTFRRDGKPVTHLQPYLATYAHVTAIHQGDLAFAHLHPDGTASSAGGGPTLTLHADLPESGNYRVFIQFQTNETLHTAPITLAVG